MAAGSCSPRKRTKVACGNEHGDERWMQGRHDGVRHVDWRAATSMKTSDGCRSLARPGIYFPLSPAATSMKTSDGCRGTVSRQHVCALVERQ